MRSYGIFNFALDALATVFTGGLWLIWVLIREIKG